MSHRIHVTMALDLFVEDAAAMRQVAFERLRGAWSGEDDFPYESEADLPLDVVVHSLLADALPADLSGCRRSQLEVVDVKADSGDDPQPPAAEPQPPAPPAGSAWSDPSTDPPTGPPANP